MKMVSISYSDGKHAILYGNIDFELPFMTISLPGGEWLVNTNFVREMSILDIEDEATIDMQMSTSSKQPPGQNPL